MRVKCVTLHPSRSRLRGRQRNVHATNQRAFETAPCSGLVYLSSTFSSRTERFITSWPPVINYFREARGRCERSTTRNAGARPRPSDCMRARDSYLPIHFQTILCKCISGRGGLHGHGPWAPCRKSPCRQVVMPGGGTHAVGIAGGSVVVGGGWAISGLGYGHGLQCFMMRNHHAQHRLPASQPAHIVCSPTHHEYLQVKARLQAFSRPCVRIWVAGWIYDAAIPNEEQAASGFTA